MDHLKYIMARWNYVYHAKFKSQFDVIYSSGSAESPVTREFIFFSDLLITYA